MPSQEERLVDVIPASTWTRIKEFSRNPEAGASDTIRFKNDNEGEQFELLRLLAQFLKGEETTQSAIGKAFDVPQDTQEIAFITPDSVNNLAQVLKEEGVLNVSLRGDDCIYYNLAPAEAAKLTAVYEQVAQSRKNDAAPPKLHEGEINNIEHYLRDVTQTLRESAGSYAQQEVKDNFTLQAAYILLSRRLIKEPAREVREDRDQYYDWMRAQVTKKGRAAIDQLVEEYAQQLDHIPDNRREAAETQFLQRFKSAVEDELTVKMQRQR